MVNLALELWEMWSTRSLPLLQSPFWPEAVAADRDLSMGQIAVAAERDLSMGQIAVAADRDLSMGQIAVAADRDLSMGQIELDCVLMLN